MSFSEFSASVKLVAAITIGALAAQVDTESERTRV